MSDLNPQKAETTKAAAPLTRAAQVNEDLSALFRARNTLLWVITREEKRVESAIIEAAANAKLQTLFWDCATGISDAAYNNLDPAGLPDVVLGRIRASKSREVYVLRDLHKWLDPSTLRAVRSLARDLQRRPASEAKVMVILTPSAEVPPELAGHAIVIDYPIPDRAEMEAILADAMSILPDNRKEKAALSPEEKDAVVDAAVGLTAEEASNCFAKSLVTKGKIFSNIVSSEKKRVIAREKVLTWHDPDPRGMAAIGGLDELKGWLALRQEGFSAAARAYGLPPPKGALLLGIPGTGKSLTAKCIATAWKMPLLRLDLGALKSKWVGESEQNVRKALQVAEAVAPCVLWLDEIEKALGGATGPQGDGGVSADALGAVLSWMQERSGSVFVVATANDISGLPPELLRKGRFDEIFFLDLPTHKERVEILQAVAKRFSTSPFEKIDFDAVAKATENFTGAEVDAIFPDALFAAFNEGKRPVSTKDLLSAAKGVVPLAQTAKEKIERLREWASSRARRASSVEKTKAGKERELDLD